MSFEGLGGEGAGWNGKDYLPKEQWRDSGLHAADLIHEASNARATGQTIQDILFNVHTHPTLSEVLDELFKQCSLAKNPF